MGDNLYDFRGLLIQVGNFIVYPTRRGATLRMVEAQVVDIIRFGNITQLKVRRLKQSDMFASSNNHWTEKLDPVDQRLVYVAPSRVTVVG